MSKNIGLAYLLAVALWLAFIGFVMVEFSPEFAWLLLIPAFLSLKTKSHD